MNRHHKIFKTSSGLSTGKAQLNHIIFSPSQTGETVPLTALDYAIKALPLFPCSERDNKGRGAGQLVLAAGQRSWCLRGKLEERHCLWSPIFHLEQIPAEAAECLPTRKTFTFCSKKSENIVI